MATSTVLVSGKKKKNPEQSCCLNCLHPPYPIGPESAGHCGRSQLSSAGSSGQGLPLSDLCSRRGRALDHTCLHHSSRLSSSTTAVVLASSHFGYKNFHMIFQLSPIPELGCSGSQIPKSSWQLGCVQKENRLEFKGRAGLKP